MINALLWINLVVNLIIGIVLTIGYYNQTVVPRLSKATYIGALIAPTVSILTSLVVLI